MRCLSSVHFLFAALASVAAQQIPACPNAPPNIPALSIEAEFGNPRAQLELGQAYSESNEAGKLSLSIYWFEKAAEQGSADAEWRLAQAYGAGAGVTRDEKSVLHWVEKAADDGQGEAQLLLGLYYRDGRLVERDHKKAFDWFLRSAKQGVVDSQVSIAQMYEDGDAVPAWRGTAWASSIWMAMESLRITSLPICILPYQTPKRTCSGRQGR